MSIYWTVIKYPKTSFNAKFKCATKIANAKMDLFLIFAFVISFLTFFLEKNGKKGKKLKMLFGTATTGLSHKEKT